MTFPLGPATVAALSALLLCLLLSDCSPKSGIATSKTTEAVRAFTPQEPSGEAAERTIGKPSVTRVGGRKSPFPSRGEDPETSEPAPGSLALSSGSLELLKRASFFAPSLLSKTLEKAGSDNVALSPVSLEMVLGMILRGASESARQEILGFLNLEGSGLDELGAYHRELLGALNALSGKSLKVRLGNALWAQTGFPVEKDYIQSVRTYYDATVEQLDFAGNASSCVSRINAWGSEATDGLIPSVLGSIPSSTRLILANATYMKADWERPFDPKQTRKEPFHKADGSVVETDFMSQTLRTQYYVGERYSALCLPYVGGDLVMTLVLPDKGTDPSDLTGLLVPSNIPFRRGRVTVEMPKFTFSFSRDLTGELKDMGIKRVFTDGSLPLIAPSLGVSQVFQSDFLEVDETGTKAAAVTIGMVSMTSLPEDPVSIRLDRPFFFSISSLGSGCVLMMGRVSDPR